MQFDIDTLATVNVTTILKKFFTDVHLLLIISKL